MIFNDEMSSSVGIKQTMKTVVPKSISTPLKSTLSKSTTKSLKGEATVNRSVLLPLKSKKGGDGAVTAKKQLPATQAAVKPRVISKSADWFFDDDLFS